MAAVDVLTDAEAYWAGTVAAAGESLDRPSGCDGWDNRELIDHVVGGGHRYAMLLDGASAADTATTRENDYVGTDPIGEFWRYERLFRVGLDAADLDATVDHRAGPRPGRDLLTMRIMELALHTRDLCVGLSLPWAPSATVTEYLLEEGATVIEDLRAHGMFAAAGVAASDAPADRLLAFAGRS
ncbi:maleylpyruvate isomerase N-terminal domain-containing protein [Tsukamurella pseudospumae]|uniref:Mycothiol-dependent maleylpyruvate isomerase metal-binding domain-containing protein n=1 Tax=Tsukamurella pseudospumae TaxID=239498 RepID=A0A137Z6U9_9ACTN|nr:maleylpyruvate isomerase N-terminal domain-containing protein [Tsukamurella pseudospumae]KXO93909.1 hypothetical protein AXK61_05055 [Tsukamurella pseudospumae]